MMPDRGQIIGIKTTAFESYIQKKDFVLFWGMCQLWAKISKKRSPWITFCGLFSYQIKHRRGRSEKGGFFRNRDGFTLQVTKISVSSSILTSLHTLILHTDPSIFPLPNLSLISIIICNATDSSWQEHQPPRQSNTNVYTRALTHSLFVEQTV